jgi:hypothetical protein
MKRYRWFVVAVMGSLFGTVILAADRAEYNRRRAEQYVEMFRMNDINRDNVVSRQEASTTVELVAHFNDIDIDRDGSITLAELTRYIEANFR